MTTHIVSWWRVTQNIISLTIRELLNKGTYLILGIVIARSMGREAFGSYTLSLLLSRSFFTIGDLGFGTWLVREVSQARESAGRYFGTIGIYRILSGFIVIFLLSGFLSLAHYNPSLKCLILLSAFAFFFVHLVSFIFSFFRAFEKMENELWVSLVKSILFISGGIWAISQKSLNLFFHAFIFSSAVAFLYALLLYGWRIGWRGLRWEPMHLSGVLPIWLIQSIVMVYLYLATVLLSFFRGIAEVGLYHAAYSFIEVILVLSTILTIAYFPVFSRLAKISLQSLFSFYEETFRAILFFFVPCGILALCGARTLLESFYGVSFQATLPALYILLSGFLFFILGGLNSHLLVAMGKEKIVLGVVVFCAVFNLVLNLWAIPRFGFVGASAVTLISEIVMFSLMVHWIAKSFRTSPFLQGTSLVWIHIVWILFVFSLVRVSFWIQLPLGLGAYALLAFFFHRHLSNELRAVKALWKELRER